jgi:hypothetical protein
MNPTYIVSLILMLRIWKGDAAESHEHRVERLLPTAQAIAKHARTPEELAALLTIAEAESHFASYVLEGHCDAGPKGSRCDPDSHGVPRATGPWQVWIRYCRGVEVYSEGSAERIEASAACAMGRLRFGMTLCPRDGWEGTFSAYKASRCNWEGAAPRVQRMRQILGMIRGGKAPKEKKP